MPNVATRVSSIRARIDAALRRAGDADRRITIVAVTKNHPAPLIEEVAAAGIGDIGENRVQEAISKSAEVRARVRWHLIGHLQRNKVARAVELFSVIHSVDTPRLARALGGAGARLQAFLQINVSGEETKSGAAPDRARELWQAALKSGLSVVGLMTMAPFSDDPEVARPAFRGLRELRDDLDRTGDGPPLSCLSMGMSGDFEVAVEEGATHLRIGTALTGGTPPLPR